jgi:hypothetical protein
MTTYNDTQAKEEEPFQRQVFEKGTLFLSLKDIMPRGEDD